MAPLLLRLIRLVPLLQFVPTSSALSVSLPKQLATMPVSLPTGELRRDHWRTSRNGKQPGGSRVFTSHNDRAGDVFRSRSQRLLLIQLVPLMRHNGQPAPSTPGADCASAWLTILPSPFCLIFLPFIPPRNHHSARPAIKHRTLQIGVEHCENAHRLT
jgi:hypothetical protein